MVVPAETPPPSDQEEEGQRSPNPIGVPNQVYNEDTDTWEPWTADVQISEPGLQDRRVQQRSGRDLTRRDMPPQYHDGDQDRFGTMGFEETLRLQEKLVEAGVLDPGDFSPGTWDNASANAMKEIMGIANRHGTSWESSLDRMVEVNKQIGQEAVDEEILEIKPFTPPSYEEMAETARGTIEGELGRELKDYEVEIMVDKLKGFHRESWENDVAIQRARRDAQKEAKEKGAPETEPVTQQGVQDPTLAYRAFAREHFEEEMDRDEDVKETAQNRNLSLRIFRSLGEV